MNETTLPFGFGTILADYPVKALSAVNKSDGRTLTKALLSYDHMLERDESEALIDRGLLEWKDGKLSVTECGMKSVSIFPLFGEKRARRPYPEAFFPFLFSAVSSSMLQSGRWQKLISSDFFTSLFPGIDKERIGMASVKAVESLISLGIIDDSNTELRVSREEERRFMKLSEEERLSLVITGKTERYAHFIYLSSLLSGIKEEELDEYLALCTSLSGAEIDKEYLFLFSILDGDEGEITARSFITERTSDFSVSSDFSITYSGKTPAGLYLYATPLLSDSISEWKITKQAAKAAFSAGMTPEEINSELSSISSYPLPETLYPRLSGWFQSFSTLHAERALILKADERNARIIDALPTLQMHILGKLGENIFLMNPDTELLWRRALENAGFDMLGPTKGPRFEKEEEKASIIPPPSFERPAISEERVVPFDKESQEKLLKASTSPLRTALILSGFVVMEEQETPRIAEVNGLYYQEKARLIHQAITEGKKLYVEFTDGETLIGRAEKIDDERIRLSGREIDIAKIWKTASLPVSVKDAVLLPSDNDSQ